MYTIYILKGCFHPKSQDKPGTFIYIYVHLYSAMAQAAAKGFAAINSHLWDLLHNLQEDKSTPSIGCHH